MLELVSHYRSAHTTTKDQTNPSKVILSANNARNLKAQQDTQVVPVKHQNLMLNDPKNRTTTCKRIQTRIEICIAVYNVDQQNRRGDQP